MPANLTPQYISAEERYKQAKDDRERLKALKEMLAVIPKHKGTEKLQGEIKRKIARLKDEIEGQRSKKGTRKFSFHVEKEGAGQLALVGTPSSGKSQLVNSLTNATFEVADYPYTTRIFQPAMMLYEDIQVQLVDLPPISAEYMENWVPAIIKNGDGILLTIDLSREDAIDQLDGITDVLRHHKIELIDKQLAEDDLRWTYLKSLFIGTKLDLPQSVENLAILTELYETQFSIISCSMYDQQRLEKVKQEIVALLDIVRIYSKRPGYEPEYNRPFVFARGSTLLDFASAVHKDFADKLKFARVWGANKFDGQRVTREYILQEKDVIELHL